jgi:hypothetical protein
MDPEYELKPMFKVTALKYLMIGRTRDYFETLEANLPGKPSEAQFEDLLKKVKEYTARRRLESNKKKSGDGMEIDEVWDQGGEWIQDWFEEEEWEDEEAYALGKGKVSKGKGKGGKMGKGMGFGAFMGRCYYCGESGHSQAFCPHKGKGFKGVCNACGAWGHTSKFCPSQNKGKFGSKGKGKFMHEFEEEQPEEEASQAVEVGAEAGGFEISALEEATSFSHANEEDRHERIRVTNLADSDASDAVSQPEVFAAFAVRSNEASKKGVMYRTASDEAIGNEGEERTQGWTDEGRKLGAVIQVAKVNKVFGSVFKIVDVGNAMVFDTTGSYVANKSNGACTPLRHENEASEFDARERSDAKESCALNSKGFQRQGK